MKTLKSCFSASCMSPSFTRLVPMYMTSHLAVRRSKCVQDAGYIAIKRAWRYCGQVRHKESAAAQKFVQLACSCTCASRSECASRGTQARRRACRGVVAYAALSSVRVTPRVARIFIVLARLSRGMAQLRCGQKNSTSRGACNSSYWTGRLRPDGTLVIGRSLRVPHGRRPCLSQILSKCCDCGIGRVMFARHPFPSPNNLAPSEFKVRIGLFWRIDYCSGTDSEVRSSSTRVLAVEDLTSQDYPS